MIALRCLSAKAFLKRSEASTSASALTTVRQLYGILLLRIILTPANRQGRVRVCGRQEPCAVASCLLGSAALQPDAKNIWRCLDDFSI